MLALTIVYDEEKKQYFLYGNMPLKLANDLIFQAATKLEETSPKMELKDAKVEQPV